VAAPGCQESTGGFSDGLNSDKNHVPEEYKRAKEDHGRPETREKAKNQHERAKPGKKIIRNILAISGFLGFVFS